MPNVCIFHPCSLLLFLDLNLNIFDKIWKFSTIISSKNFVPYFLPLHLSGILFILSHSLLEYCYFFFNFLLLSLHSPDWLFNQHDFIFTGPLFYNLKFIVNPIYWTFYFKNSNLVLAFLFYSFYSSDVTNIFTHYAYYLSFLSAFKFLHTNSNIWVILWSDSIVYFFPWPLVILSHVFAWGISLFQVIYLFILSTRL